MIILNGPKDTERAIKNGADPRKLADVKEIQDILLRGNIKTYFFIADVDGGFSQIVYGDALKIAEILFYALNHFLTNYLHGLEDFISLPWKATMVGVSLYLWKAGYLGEEADGDAAENNGRENRGHYPAN